MPQLANHVRQLIDALPGIICLGVFVLGAEVAPLEAVDGTEVAFFAVGEADAVKEGAGAVAVPDLDALGGERVGGGVAADEPEEFGDDGAEKDAFCGEEGEDECV